MINRDDILIYLKEYKQTHKDYNIEKIGLFGSIVRGENSDSSDIDIVVELKNPNIFIQAGIMEDLKDKFQIAVDVISLSKSINPKLLKRIEKEAIYV